MLAKALHKVMQFENLAEQEMNDALAAMLEGQATTAQIGAFLIALRMKGESLEEITTGARFLRSRAQSISLNGRYAIDTCGTGGDGTRTFNISTATALVAASCGVTVAKHGNRSVSSQCGSADVLEELGLSLEQTPSQVERCINEVGIGFVFAPSFHAAMRYVAQPRRELAVRTIFNILGPLANPAGVQGQVLGVFDHTLTEKLAYTLQNLGVQRALVVCGRDGMDEITLTTTTKISRLEAGRVETFDFDPRDYGFELVPPAALVGGDAAANARIIQRVLGGETGPKRNIVVLNSAAALIAGGQADSFSEAIKLAERAIDSGAALEKLEQLISFQKGDQKCS